MKKNILIAGFWLLSISLMAQAETSSISSKVGAFSRMGFGARGIGMGNALSAVTEGNLVSYYNPALSPFQKNNSFQTSYSFLSLDRSLNFLNFTKKFEFGTQTDTEGNTKPRSTAGISAGIINAGVSKIDSRDNQGRKLGDISTSENQFFVSVANRFSNKLAIGIAFKFYYYKLYEEVTSTSLGIDIGAIYLLNDNITLSFMISDLNSKYSWDTGKLFGTSGLKTDDQFPISKKIGASYKFTNQNLILAAEFENSNAGTNIFRGGAEYMIYENLFIRAGFDKLNISNSDFPVRPSAGFSYLYSLSSTVIGIDYAFAMEPYSLFDQHIVGINLNF
ncbi:MAG: hypothetical protein KF816_11110 [Melioribacteraceae bacterium]|nr:hypothetical protein [Melioribacteraceae bacterium]